jgi:hypothetical protein
VRNKKNTGELLAEPSGRNRNNLIHNYKHEKGSRVKRNITSTTLHLQLNPPRPKKSGQLVPVVFHYPRGDEFVYYPLCSRCGLPIVDLEMANVCEWGRDNPKLTPLGWQDEIGCRASLVAGQIYFFHKDCDNSPSGSGWVNADNVFKSDQRFEFQKRWEKEANEPREVGGVE